MLNKSNMKLTGEKLLILYSFWAILFMLSYLNVQDGEGAMDFRHRILKIQEKVVDLTSPGALFDSNLFLEIWDHPEKYTDDVNSFLADAKVSDTQKVIAGLSMQSLPLDKFIRFCDYVLNLKLKRKITAKVFYNIILPGYDWNTKLQENFQNPEVRRLLIRLREIVPEVKKDNREYEKKYIDEILSGEANLHIKDLRSAGQIR
jgi:hypothetical protein